MSPSPISPTLPGDGPAVTGGTFGDPATGPFRTSATGPFDPNASDSPAGATTATATRWHTLSAPVLPVLRRLAGPVTALGAVAILAAVLLAVLAVLTGWQEFAVAAMVLALTLAVSALFLIGRSSYAVTVQLQNARVVAGQRAGGAMTTRNTGQRRLLGSRIELPVGGSLASFRIPTLAPGAEHEDLFVIPTTRRAVITVGPAVSVRGDALGLLRRQVRWTIPQALYVHPRTMRLHGASTGVMRDLEGQPTRDLSSNDVSFHALRGYVPGDDRRYVHWRTSARTGKLMVRQFEETRRTHLAVALAADPAEYETTDEFELAVSAAASLGAQAFREERPVSVCVGPATLVGGTGRQLLDAFAGVATAEGAGIVTAGRAAAAAVPNASVAVLVCGPKPDAPTIRRAGSGFGIGIRVVCVRVEDGAPAGMSSIGGIDVATVGSLEDLPRALHRMRAA